MAIRLSDQIVRRLSVGAPNDVVYNPNSTYLFYVGGTTYTKGIATHDGNIVPGANNTINLGALDKRWANIYGNILNISNSADYNTAAMYKDGVYISAGQVVISHIHDSTDVEPLIIYGNGVQCLHVLSRVSSAANTYGSVYLEIGSQQANPSIGGAKGYLTLYAAEGEKETDIDHHALRMYGGGNEFMILGTGSSVANEEAPSILSIGSNPKTSTAQWHTHGILRIYSLEDTYTDIRAQSGYSKIFYLPHYNGDMYAVHAGSTAAVGSSGQPVYVAADGRVTKTTYLLGATTSAGTASRLAYYSGANIIAASSHYSSAAKVGINYTSAPTQTFLVNGTSAFLGDINIYTADADRSLIFGYTQNTTTTTANGASWRIVSKGSGSSDTNYFAIESSTSTTGDNKTWNNVLRAGMNTYDILLGSTTNVTSASTGGLKTSGGLNVALIGWFGSFVKSAGFTADTTFDSTTFKPAITLYPSNSNEINFGGYFTGNRTIYFGYRKINDREIPTQYWFGPQSRAGITFSIAAANAQGESYITLGNGKDKSEAENARGRIRMYGTNTKYSDLIPQNNANNNTYYLTAAPAASYLFGYHTYSTDLDTLYDAGIFVGSNGTNGLTSDGKYYSIISIPYRKASGNTTPDWTWQLGSNTSNGDHLYFRNSNASTWNGWRTIAHVAKDTKTGDASSPVYIDSNGAAKAITYLINATVNAGTQNYLAFYSSNNAISAATEANRSIKFPSHYYHELYNSTNNVYIHLYNGTPSGAVTTHWRSFNGATEGAQYTELTLAGGGAMTWNGADFRANQIYANLGAKNNAGGVSLYSTSAPTSYGIALRSSTAFGWATATDWGFHFYLDGGTTRGWKFYYAGSPVTSIDATGYTSTRRLNLMRQSGVNYGRIYWYKHDYVTWVDYMSDAANGAAPTGGKPGTAGNVTSWAKRSLIENSSGYGWTWEAAANTAQTTNTVQPTTRMVLSSYTGQLRVASNATSTTNETGTLILSTAENGSSGNVALELWRGNNASWQLANEGGVFYLRTNYTTAKQSTYSVNTLIVDYNTGAASIPYLAIGQATRNTTYRLVVAGNTLHNGIVYFANGTTYYINNNATANLYHGNFADTTNTTGVGTGSLTVAGGVSIAKDLWTTGDILRTNAGRFQKVTFNPSTSTPAEGWYRVCKLSALYNYANFLILFTGGWSSGAPTMATVSVHFRNNLANVTLLHRGYSGNWSKMRLVKDADSSNVYWLDLYTAGLTSGTINEQRATFIGNVNISDIATTMTPFTDTVTAQAELTFAQVDGIHLTNNNYTSYVVSVRDYNDGKPTKFGYSTTGLTNTQTSWIAAWDTSTSGEYRLRAINTANLKKFLFGTTAIGGPDTNNTKFTPVYYNGSNITAAATTVGSGVKPIYMASGALTASAATAGSTLTPVYLNSGELTAGQHIHPAYDNTINDLNTAYNTGSYTHRAGTLTNGPNAYKYGNTIVFSYRKHSGNTTPDYASQIYLHGGNSTDSSQNTLFYRSSSASAWNAWQAVAHITATNADVGSLTKPVYVTKNGTVTACTYSLSATINAGTANTMAYYSGANAISSAAAHGYSQYGYTITEPGGKSPFFRLTGSQTSFELLIGSGNTNRGLYDVTNSCWILYKNADSNLLSHANLLSDGNNTYGLGISATRWKNAYIQTNIFIGGTSYTAWNSEANGSYMSAGAIVANNTTAREGYYVQCGAQNMGRWYMGKLGTATTDNGDGTYTSAIGYCQLILGNSLVGATNATGSVAKNARGVISIYGTGANYTNIWAQANGNRDCYLPNYAGAMYLIHAGNNNALGGTAQPIYLQANGRVAALSATVGGATTAPTYLNAGTITVMTDIEMSSANTNSRTVRVKNNNGQVDIRVSTNWGLYDTTNSRWIIYNQKSDSHVYVPDWASKGSASWPVYFTSSGAPAECTSVAGLAQNNISTYTNTKIVTAKGSYYGFYLGSEANKAMNIMSHTAGQHHGLYFEGKRWILYYDATNDRCAIGSSTTTAGYLFTVSGSQNITGVLNVAGGNITAPAGSIWAGKFTANTAQSAQYNIGTQSGAGKIYFYSAAATTGNRGIYSYNAANTAGGILTINQSNQISGIATFVCSPNVNAEWIWIHRAGSAHIDCTNETTSVRIGMWSDTTNQGIYSYSYWNGSANASGAGWIIYRGTDSYVHSSFRLYSAVWNDYAEYRKASTTEPGRVVMEQKGGIMTITQERLAAGAKIISDTFGFAIGQNGEYNTPIAVSGRVLVYTYKPRTEYPLGAAVCAAPGGTVDIMTREEIMMYPERIIGTVSEIPDYEIWHAGSKEAPEDIKVNGRIWIYVK